MIIKANLLKIKKNLTKKVSRINHNKIMNPKFRKNKKRNKKMLNKIKLSKNQNRIKKNNK